MTSRLRAVGWAVLVVLLARCCSGKYLITTPKEWMYGSDAQVCVDVHDETAPPGHLTISVSRTQSWWDENQDEIVVLPNTTISVPPGSVQFCKSIGVPQRREHRYYGLKLWLRGEVAGDFLNYTQDIDFQENTEKVFIQTDKFLYQPGQKVQIRMLTMYLSNASISTVSYPEVWVTTPTRSRIAQWNNVDNSAGLVHLELTLADEPVKGQYKVYVRTRDGRKHSINFEVKEYTLPRFEVTVKPMGSYLASDPFVTAQVCAKYTYGQAVKGILTLEVNNRMPGPCWKATNTTYPINGCDEVQIELATMGVIECGVYKLQLRAMVMEAGTEVLLQSLSDVEISTSAFTFKKIYQTDYKKLGLPYTIKVRLDKRDGAPAANVPVEMCKNDICANITVPDDGMIVTNVGTERFTSVKMKPLHSRLMLYETSFKTEVQWFYSPSNSSLMIYTPDEEMKCTSGESNTKYNLPVFFVSDQDKAAITVQIISKRRIQYLKTQEFYLTPGDLPLNPGDLVEPLEEPPLGTRRGMLNIPITLDNSIHTIAPSARVLVWLVRPDGEVVADVRDVKIQKCLPNKAELSWSEPLVYPGQEVEMQLTAAPNSLCSLGVVDKSTRLLDTRPESLSLDSIFNPLQNFHLSTWSSDQYNDYEHCKDQLGELGVDTRPWSSFTRYIDTMWIFSKSGLYVFSDLLLNNRLCEKKVYPSLLHQPVHDTDRVAYSGIGMGMDREVIVSAGEDEARTEFPETWLWNLYALPESGTYSTPVTLPDTITEWVGQAVCVHPQIGLGLSGLTNITTFTPFFLDLTLPPSIKRGETLGVLISLFNYMKVPLPVIIKLHKSSEYEIIKEPSSHAPEGVLDVCVGSSSKVVMEIKIKPTVIGQVNITVEASVDQKARNDCGTSAARVSKRDKLVKPITVKAEGFLKEKTWNKYICVDDLNDGSDLVDKWDVEAPEGIVEGSDRGWVNVEGSLLSVSLDNLDHLIRMPYGCGEQNMIRFAPNVFILRYLSVTRQSTPEVDARISNLMKIGYQRQLLYLRSDGSYSAFGSADDEGSTWLTAFVVKSFAQARPFITIDSERLNDSVGWLLETQGRDGCFPSVGQVFNKALKGGLDLGKIEAMTSYVLVALLEATEDNVTPTTRNATLNATACLLNLSVHSRHPYNLALKAYALGLMRHSKSAEVLEELMAQAEVTTSSIHWNLPPGHSNSKSLEVETAGYAILAMLTVDPQEYEQQVRKVIKWITEQRNGQGGFYSTQDTVVALQALAEYESMQYQGDLDLVATVKGTGIDHSFAVTKDNKLVTQQAPIRTLPTSLTITMVGNGCAAIQSVLRYNVNEPDPSDTFSLSVNTQTAADKTCTTKWINLCANYLLISEKSNMAVIEVDLVSGYIPVKDDLKKVVRENPGVIKRYEVDGSKVMFYIEEFVAGKEVCLRMRVTRIAEVEGAKPGSVTVYDYYQPEFSVSKVYNLPLSSECVNA